MRLSLLDSDTLSLSLRDNDSINANVARYLADFGPVRFSVVTYFEILRGLRFRDARTRMARFEAVSSQSHVLPVSIEIADRAAWIHADLRRRGVGLPDADTLIAATAIVHDLVLITNNESDFHRIPGLVIENWSIPA